MTGLSATGRLPFWAHALLALEAIVAALLVPLAWTVGGAFPMAARIDPVRLAPFALPFAFVLICWIAYRWLWNRGQRRAAIVMALAPTIFALLAMLVWG